MRITLDFADKPTWRTEDGTVRQGQILEVNKKKACVANGDYMDAFQKGIVRKKWSSGHLSVVPMLFPFLLVAGPQLNAVVLQGSARFAQGSRKVLIVQLGRCQ